MNFYKRYVGDYARDTGHLSLMEHGAYQVLLDTYYATGGQIPAAKDELYRLARAMTPAERKAVNKVSDQFFPVNGDGTRHNKRADEELASYTTQAETNRRITEERERRRKEKDSLNEPLDEPLDEPLTNRGTNRHTKGSTNDQPNQKPEARVVQKLCGFEDFWRAYPNRQSRGDAEKAWQKLKPDEALIGRIIAAIDLAKKSRKWQKNNGEFIPYPASWLNAKGWLDEVVAKQEQLV